MKKRAAVYEIPIFLLSFAFASSVAIGATLTCGDIPCSEAKQVKEGWPEPLTDGVTIKERLRLDITIPAGFEKVTHLVDLVLFDYPATSHTEKSVGVMSFEIRPGKKNGPLGGWETLHVTEKDGVKAYFYKEMSEAVPTFSAALTNGNHLSLGNL